MSLVDIMIDQIATARILVEDGDEVIPAWRISTPEGAFLVLTSFDQDKPEQRERALLLVSRFMTWKMATSFVLTVQTWLKSALAFEDVSEEALLVIGVSHHERLGLVQRLRRPDPIVLGMPEWLMPDQIDEAYVQLLPSGASEISAEEIAELAVIFGEGGEMAAQLLS